MSSTLPPNPSPEKKTIPSPMIPSNARKWILGICFCISASTGAYAQTNNASDTLRVKDSLSVEDRLVKLALESPMLKRSESQNTVSEYQLKKTKNSWLNLLTFSTSYNFQNLSKKDSNTQGVVVAPGLNAGVTIPLGIIFSKGTDIKISKEQVRVSGYNQELLRRDLKAEILTLYKQYSNVTTRILMQNKVLVDEQAAVLQAEKKFKDGMITIENYNAASKRYNDEIISKMNLELTQYQMKLSIEKIIGVPLESVLY